MAKLTERQEKLFNEIESELRKQAALCYIENGYENKTQAYLNACEILGKKPSKNPDTSGAEILNYPRVKDFIASVQAEVAESTQTNAEYVLRRLREIDELDIIDILNDNLDGFRPLSEWPKSWRISISGLDMQSIVMSDGSEEPFEKLVRKVKWPDKVKNLEMIGRHVNVAAWEKEKAEEPNDQPITINFVPAQKPDAD